VVFSIIFLSIYKLTTYYTFSGRGLIADECTTHYGGIQTGAFSEFIQTGQETCGQAVAAFFLTKIGIPETEASVIDQFGIGTMVSLADLEQIFINNGFKTQALKVVPSYFEKHPVTAILHYTEGHFVVFIQEENGTPMLFDPAYGQVYVSWDILSKVFSGYMLYVYKN
jgi:ABC-type bacteriocin/lantibiotic exporter with double-glycine peptidase domain